MDTRAAPTWSTAQVPPATAPAVPRCVVGLCDDALAASAWFAALAGEGLDLRCYLLDALVGRHEQAAPAAWVLHLAHGLPAQLPRLRELHAASPRLPLLAVCVGLRDLDHVLALEMGADDVIDATLPAPVVAARLRALWRRCESADDAPQPEWLSFGALHLQRRERRTLLGQRPLALTDGEFEVLWLLALRAGHAVPRADLVRRLRGLEYQRDDRSIDCRIYRIRAKLGDTDPASRRIRTVRNSGYLFSPLPW
ncbi:MAG TPA: response regulator transcription factor [Burkholderiaceae bacterium]|nr:response regulator transcription factor [Burkholderiaceae bacterium]